MYCEILFRYKFQYILWIVERKSQVSQKFRDAIIDPIVKIASMNKHLLDFSVQRFKGDLWHCIVALVSLIRTLVKFIKSNPRLGNHWHWRCMQSAAACTIALKEKDRYWAGACGFLFSLHPWTLNTLLFICLSVRQFDEKFPLRWKISACSYAVRICDLFYI